MANSKKRCRNCKSYKPTESMISINGAYFCNINGATTYAFKNKEKGKKIKHIAQKKNFQLSDRKIRLPAAQKAFNAFIRQRDSELACISCGGSTGCKMNAGHYKSVGSTPELRFEELNCHLQCEHCNSFKSGNIELYRPNLIKKIGLKAVDYVEGYHEAKKYTCEQLLDIENYYKQKLKEMVE